MLLIKIASKFCQANRDQFKTHENMHILLAFITKPKQTEVKLTAKWSLSTFVRTKRL